MKLYIVIIFLSFSTQLLAQNSQLEYDLSKWPTQTVVHYSKANWDGSNKGFVSVYFKDNDWIEALKWHEGHAQATIVPAKIDHKTFNVSHFKNFRCQNGECRQLGEMYWDQNLEGFIMQLGNQSDTITNLPTYWHSYDFDFSSLMAAFIFKKDLSSHTFKRADFQRINEDLVFGPMGAIEMTYGGQKLINGEEHHLYTINGPGLNNRGGEIWFDQNTMLLKGFKIQEPDENSYNSVDFQYLGQEQMRLEKWEAFKKEKY